MSKDIIQEQEEFERHIFKKYRKSNKPIFEVPFSEFETSDFRLLEMTCVLIKYSLGVNWNYTLWYCDEKVIFYERRRSKMEYKYTIKIPYGNRNTYYECLFRINCLIDEDGMFMLAVNNNPYSLESLVVIHTNTNNKEIKELIAYHHIDCDDTKGLTEILIEQRNHRWNTLIIPSMDKQIVFSDTLNSIFFFKDTEKLKKQGFGNKVNTERKKIFISYCHKNSDIVHKISSMLSDAGTNIWIDIKSIDYGDNIIDHVMNGIDESDLCILFLSGYTKESLFAKKELYTIYKDIIYDMKKWLIVKLDDTNLDDIIHGLNGYKYYSYINDDNDLVDVILKRIDSL